MAKVAGTEVRGNEGSRIALALLLGIFLLGAIGCSKQGSQAQDQEPASARHYKLVGKVVSIDNTQSSITVDSQAVPGFMDAMIMPYTVHNAQELTTLHPGDEITADIVVTNDGAYLQHIAVTTKASSAPPPPQPAPTSTQRDPHPGDEVPDFVLVNQDGRRIHLHSFRGDVVLLTFIYTRCPFPNYCPLVSQNFADIYASIRKNPSLNARVRLLSVSFDPEHDTPAALRDYSERFQKTTQGIPFARWQFTVVPKQELPEVVKFFGFYLDTSGGQITHSLSTSVISPEGTIYKWYDDNSWKPADLLTDARQSLAQGKSTPQSHAGDGSSKSSGSSGS